MRNVILRNHLKLNEISKPLIILTIRTQTWDMQCEKCIGDHCRARIRDPLVSTKTRELWACPTPEVHDSGVPKDTLTGNLM